jgi:xanthine dehydrogenase iron-sulfur cluster and FAD-binding subunit A
MHDVNRRLIASQKDMQYDAVRSCFAAVAALKDDSVLTSYELAPGDLTLGNTGSRC